MQLLNSDVRRELFCAERPIHAKSEDKSSSYIGPDGKCLNSLVADGCSVNGVVVNSILFPGVVVEEGAVVQNCILFKDVKVGSNTKLSYVIADKRSRFQADRTLMGHATYPLVIAKDTKV